MFKPVLCQCFLCGTQYPVGINQSHKCPNCITKLDSTKKKLAALELKEDRTYAKGTGMFKFTVSPASEDAVNAAEKILTDKYMCPDCHFCCLDNRGYCINPDCNRYGVGL